MRAHSIHKYYRAQFRSGTPIFRCGFEGCSHFVYEPLILNKETICWRCNCVTTITPKTLRAKKFHCVDCTRGKFNALKEKTAKNLNEEALDDIISTANLFLLNLENEENEEKDDPAQKITNQMGDRKEA